MAKIKCTQCGKEKEKCPSTIKEHNFCNKKCYGDWISGPNNQFWKNGGITSNCAFCGKEKKVNSYFFNKNQNSFCNQICRGKFQSLKQKGKNNPFYGKHHTSKVINHLREQKIGKPNPKLSETKKRLYAEGKLIPTWKGKKLSFKVWNKNKTHLDDQKIIAREKHCLFGKFGKNHPSYIHGMGYWPYSREFRFMRQKIFERDNHTCQICLIHRDYLNLAGIWLEAHHIDSNMNNNLPQNLISLCTKCHQLLKAKDRREHWMKFFHSMLTKDYGYKYTENQKIILDFNKT